MIINKIKKTLEEEREQILNRMDHYVNVAIDIDGDEVDAIQGKIIAHAATQLIARDKDKLLKINNAFKKISDGSFGKCEECDEDISEKRLLVNPGSTTCISCAEQIEIIAKRGRY